MLKIVLANYKVIPQKMADIETPRLEIVLQPERNKFTECYFFSQGSFKSKRDAQLIRDLKIELSSSKAFSC